jgi:hypothetical protein
MRVTVPPRAAVTHTPPAPTATPAGPPPIHTVSAIALDAGSVRLTRSSSGTATQTPRAPTATPLALWPTAIVATTSFVRASIRVTVPSVLSAIHTAPKPTATPLGSLPTGILVTTRFRAGSTRATSLKPPEIHTASAVTATDREGTTSPPNESGLNVRSDCVTRRKSGSITRASERPASATQTPLGPAPSPSTLIPAEIVAATRRDRVPICITVLSVWLATHTEPALRRGRRGGDRQAPAR